MLRHPPCGRMPCMLLYGDSDIGKTMIVDKFVRDHPNICNQFGEVEARKVLRLQMPSKPRTTAGCTPRPLTASGIRRCTHAVERTSRFSRSNCAIKIHRG